MVKFVQLPKYEVYKPSKIEFSASIPESWAEVPIRSIFNERNEKNTGPKTDFILSVTRGRGVIPYDEKGAIGNNKSEDIERYKVVYKNDLVINKMNVVIGSLGLSRYYGALSQVYIVLNPKSVNFSIRYYSYIFNNEPFYKSLVRYCKGIMELRESLDKDQFKKLYLPLPIIEEQELISNFLDQKTAQIDAAIAIKEQQIELLKERKQIIIQQAVTQGLDPNVPMKDSGVEWIGQIPEHWGCVKLKLLCQFILDGTHGSYSRTEDGYRLLSVRNIINDEFVFRDDDSRVSFKHFKEISSKFLIKPGDIQLAIVGATLGKVAVVPVLPEKFVTQRSVATIRTNKNSSNIFVASFMRSFSFQSFLWNSVAFSAQPGIYLNTIQNSYISVPPLQEQILIANYIGVESDKYNKAIRLQERHIQKLKEYKTTLINSAVTGKIKITPEMLQA